MEPAAAAVEVIKFDITTITLLGVIAVNIIAAIAIGVVQIIAATKVAKIEAHVNGERTAAEGTRKLLENENRLLKDMVADKTMTARLLAQAAAVRSREPGATPLPPAVAAVVDETLKHIEANTAETAAAATITAENTKKE